MSHETHIAELKRARLTASWEIAAIIDALIFLLRRD